MPPPESVTFLSQDWHILVPKHTYRPFLAAKASTDIHFTARGETSIALWWTINLSWYSLSFCMEYSIVRFSIDINWFKYIFIVHILLRKHRQISILLRDAKYSWSCDALWPCHGIFHRFCMEYSIVRFNIGINWFKYMFIVYTSLRKHRLISILLREAKYSWSYDELTTSAFLTKSQSWRYKHNSYNEIFII